MGDKSRKELSDFIEKRKYISSKVFAFTGMRLEFGQFMHVILGAHGSKEERQKLLKDYLIASKIMSGRNMKAVGIIFDSFNINNTPLVAYNFDEAPTAIDDYVWAEMFLRQLAFYNNSALRMISRLRE